MSLADREEVIGLALVMEHIHLASDVAASGDRCDDDQFATWTSKPDL